MITDVDGVVVVGAEVWPLLVDFRRRNAAAEDAFAGAGRVDVLERVGDRVGVGKLLLVADRFRIQVELKDIDCLHWLKISPIKKNWLLSKAILVAWGS